MQVRSENAIRIHPCRRAHVPPPCPTHALHEKNLQVESETNYWAWGEIPFYATSKLHMSNEAVDEIEDLQAYVQILAEHDLNEDSGAAPFATAAFDLASPHVLDVQSGWQDWDSCFQEYRLVCSFYYCHVLFMPVSVMRRRGAALLDNDICIYTHSIIYDHAA